MLKALLHDPVLTCFFGMFLGAALTAGVVILDRLADRRNTKAIADAIRAPHNAFNPYARKQL